MAYIDTTRITDRHAKKLIDKDSDLVTDALWNAEKDAKAQARFCGVNSADIPLADGTGDLTAGNLISEPLYSFCEYRFLYHLFSGVAGVVDSEDIYMIKMQMAEKNAMEIKENITYSTIVTDDNEVVDSDDRSRNVVIGC